METSNLQAFVLLVENTIPGRIVQCFAGTRYRYRVGMREACESFGPLRLPAVRKNLLPRCHEIVLVVVPVRFTVNSIRFFHAVALRVEIHYE